MSHFSAQLTPGESENLRRQAAQALAANKLAEAEALLKKAYALNPSSPDICNDLARALWRGGNHRAADEYFLKALNLAPREAYYLNSYGVFLMLHFRYHEALDILNRALEMKPGFHEILNNLGLLHHRRGEWAEAEKYFLQAIRAQPNLPGAHGNLAALLRDMKQYDRAEAEFRAALKLAPGNRGGWQVLAEFYRSIGRYDAALGILKDIASRAFFSEEAWLPILELQEGMSRLDDAWVTLRDLKARFPQSMTILFMEAKLLRRSNKPAEALAILEKMGMPGKSSPHYLAWLFEVGQLQDRLGNADAAFQAFSRANNAQLKSPEAAQLNKNEYIAGITRFRDDFTPEVASAVTAAAKPAGKPGPVFLVGFPRSGTTLLDQILSSHPRVTVAEEQPASNRMTMHLIKKYGGTPPTGPDAYDGGVREWLMNNDCYPRCLKDVTEEDAQELRRLFYISHNVQPGDEKLFVDKFPLNLRHAGLIHRVFPDAKFILALRHPCDSVLSGFMQQFQLNPAMMPFLELKSAARLYDETFRLWDAYAQSLPLKVHAVRYEDVVADFRPTVAKLLDFLELDWNDAVLEYDKTARSRPIATPSYHQVTEKIYTRASGRWQRYRKHMQDVIPLLEPHAKKYGYSMDESDAQE